MTLPTTDTILQQAASIHKLQALLALDFLLIKLQPGKTIPLSIATTGLSLSLSKEDLEPFITNLIGKLIEDLGAQGIDTSKLLQSYATVALEAAASLESK